MQARKAGQASAQRKDRLSFIRQKWRHHEMEVMETIAYAINSFGFPILCNVALFWYMITQRKIHKEESTQMAETINNNTQAIIALAELIKEDKDDLK